MNWKTTLLAAIAVCSLALPNLATAQDIKGPAQISASTSIPLRFPNDVRFGVAEMTNDITSDASPYRGFVGAENTLGIINFTLDKPYTLTAFHLANDVNISMESVKDFTLKFFTAANVQVGGPLSFTTVQGQGTQQNFTFPQVPNVSRTEMKVDSIYTNTIYPQIEIREVSFTGSPFRQITYVPGGGVTDIGTPIEVDPTPTTTCPGVGCLTDTSTCCPPSATFAMGDLFDFKQQGGLNGGYYFNFADSVGTQTNFATLNAQMTAYVNYVRALDPAFMGLAMTLRVFDGGTGTTAIAGAQMGTDSSIYWNAGATTGVLSPNSTFFGPTTTKPVNNWTVIEMVLWTQGPGRPYAQSCEKRYIQWNPLYRNSRRAGSSAGTSFTPYTGPAPASAARQPAARR